MKIAIVLPPGFLFSQAKPNSIETVIRTLNSRCANDDELTIFCARSDQQKGDFRVCELAYDGSRHAYIKAACAALRNYEPDIIECHQNEIVANAIARKMTPVPTLIYRHNYTKKPQDVFHRLRLWLRHRPIAGFVMVSQAVLETNCQQFPELAERCFAVPNPIDAAQWPGDAANKQNTILFSGRAAPEKGLAPLVDALVPVLEAHRDWQSVLILGEFHKHEAWAGAQIDKLKSFGDRVRILKSQPLDIVKSEISKATIAVIPSLWQEPFGLVALEAHAAGCAVVSSGSGGLREASGEHALYLDTVDGPAIAQAISRLIKDEALRLRLAKGGQEFVKTHHNVAIRQAALENIRKTVLKSALNKS
jgi:glycosyltransferase involved in cell wall biosynthesis